MSCAAGDRRALFSFYRDAKATQDSYGEMVEKKVLVCQSWCKVDQSSGNKFERANQVAKESSHTLTTIWQECLKDAEWGEWDGRRFEINDYDNTDARNREVVLMVKEAG